MVGSLYETLPSNDSIRYIALHAGKDTEPLEISLIVSSLHSMPYFEAISYVWGSSLRDHKVWCNKQLISITRNLWNALRDLRLPDKSRMLWADSICINQDDVTEKGHQVSLMGRIYNIADAVIVCLGDNQEGKATAAASLVEEIDDMVLKGVREVGTSCGAFPFLSPVEQEQRAADPRWKALLAMTEEAWFSRGWVVQEAGLSTNATIRWSGINIPWQKAVRVWMWMEQRLPQVWLQHPDSSDNMNSLHLDVYRMRHQQEMMSLYDNADSTDIFILDLFHYARVLSFAEQSDRVYALLALADSASVTLNIQPNYKTDFRQVYLDLALKYLEVVQNIKLLDYIQHTETSIEEDYPSWVPRWDLNIFEVRISSPYGMTGTPQLTQPLRTSSLQVLTNNVLKVRGVLFDFVGFVSDVFHDKPNIDEIKGLWSRVSCYVAHSGSPYTPSERDVVFTKTLSLGRHMGSRAQWEVCSTLYIQHLNRTPQQGSDKGKELDTIQYWVQSCVHKRRFIITQQENFGLGPGLSRQGDAICVLTGGRNPFVLRESSNQGHYKIIGDIHLQDKGMKPHSLGDGDENLLFFDQNGSEECTGWTTREQDIFLC